MTANQIAAQSERELERHNQTVEEETKRHNVATEELQNDANQITNSYNSTKNALTAEYNNAYLNYLNAELSEKERYQQEMNDINRQLADAESLYKHSMMQVNSLQAQTDRNYKEAVAAQGWMNAAIEAKRAYYEGQKTEAYVNDLLVQQQLKRKDLEVKESQINKQYNLGLISAEQRDTELANARMQAEARLQEVELKQHQWDEGGKELVEQQIKSEKTSRWQGWFGIKNQNDANFSRVLQLFGQ